VVFCNVGQRKLVERNLKGKYFVKRIRLRGSRKSILIYFREDFLAGHGDKSFREVMPAAEKSLPEGSGLRGKYFNNREWTGPTVFEDTVEAVDFYWEDSERPLEAPFGIILEGEILIPRAGERTFLLTSDDGSDLRIGRDFAIDNLGVHAELTKSGTGTFEKGWQPLRIRFFDIGGGGPFSVLRGKPMTSPRVLFQPHIFDWPKERKRHDSGGFVFGFCRGFHGTESSFMRCHGNS